MAQWNTVDNEHVVGYAVYDNGSLLTDHVMTGNLCRASGDITVKPVITGGYETVYASQGVQGERDVMLPVSYAVSLLPNPFTRQTSIAYALPRSSAVTMAVYDAVKTLVRDRHPAGYYTVTWSGDDDHGRTVPAGVYFVHFTADDYCTINKAILLR